MPEKIVKKSDNISVMTSSFILDSSLDNQATIQDARKQKKKIIVASHTRCVSRNVDTPAEECIARNKKRSRKVPERAIQRMQEKLVPPDKEKESWDQVEIIRE